MEGRRIIYREVRQPKKGKMSRREKENWIEPSCYMPSM